MRGVAVVVGVVVATAALSGCIGTNEVPADLQGHGAGERPLLLEGVDCLEGGGHSVHRHDDDYLPEPWVPADVLDDTGPQLVYTAEVEPTDPTPEPGETMGNYHATLHCASWTLAGVSVPELVLGYVGMKVEEPPFGDGVPVRQYLVTVLTANDADVVEALQAIGLGATLAAGSVVRTGELWHTVLDTEVNGIYESMFTAKELGPAEQGVVRLWWQAPNDDGTVSPVALDLRTTGGTHHAADGQATFTHLWTEDHPPLPGAVGHTSALLDTGIARTITAGPAPDVRLDEAWVHL